MTSRFALKSIIITGFVLSLAMKADCQTPGWRGLIVYTKAYDSTNGEANHYDQIRGTFDGINDIYFNSGMYSTKVDIAGVIRDTAYVGPDSSVQRIRDVMYGTNGMYRYSDLLNQYSADVLILLDGHARADGSAGWGMGSACYGYTNDTSFFHMIPILNQGSIWVDTIDDWIWAHEAGHVHCLTHCDGYRRTMDSLGQYTRIPSSAVSGFSTVMQYPWDDACRAGPDDDGGDLNFTAVNTRLFSNPDSSWYDSATDSIYNMGWHGHNEVGLHEAYDDTVRAFHNTPTNLTIADSMNLGRFDYANYLATNSVAIQPGFSTQGESKLRVSVGPGVMAKRGIKGTRFISNGDATSKSIGRVLNFKAEYDVLSKTMKVSFSGGANARVSFIAFDPNGKAKAHLGEFQNDGRGFSKTIALNELPKGAYFLRAIIGSDKVYKEFVRE